MSKLLIIEDNTSIRNYLTTLFSTAGFKVDTASDGAGGLDFAKIGGYQAIILDLKMPNIDGLKFLKTLQSQEHHPHNGPIIIYSSAEYEYAHKEALRLGATAFIKKDQFDGPALITEITRLISASHH